MTWATPLLTAVLLLEPPSAPDLEAMLASASGGQPAALSREDMDRAKGLFLLLLGGGKTDELTELCGELDLEAVPARDRGDLVLAVREKARQTGRGFFAARSGEARALVVAAPHALPSDDLLTGELALELFRRSGAVAGAWSTVGRDDLDLAHADASLLQALAVAFAEARPRGILLEVHGFARRKRGSAAGRAAEVIVSGGTSRPRRWLRELDRCIEAQTGLAVALYPEEVKELGGTSNAQARALAARDHPGFLHLELDLATRRRLLAEAPLLEALLRCVPEEAR